MANNLSRLWEIRDSLPHEKHDEFMATFIGSISVDVDPARWEHSLQRAKQVVEKREATEKREVPRG